MPKVFTLCTAIYKVIRKYIQVKDRKTLARKLLRLFKLYGVHSNCKTLEKDADFKVKKEKYGNGSADLWSIG